MNFKKTLPIYQRILRNTGEIFNLAVNLLTIKTYSFNM